MKKWKYKLDKLVAAGLRDVIEDDNFIATAAMLQSAYQSLLDILPEDIMDADEVQEKVDDIDLIDVGDEDALNYELSEFYDLCDNLGIWIDTDATIHDADNDIDSDVDESLNESATDALPMESGVKIGMSSIINDLIKDEYEAIDGYNSAIATAMEEGFDDAVKVLTEIQAEEHIHVGQLQEVMKLFDPNADKVEYGKQEGAEQLSEDLFNNYSETNKKKDIKEEFSYSSNDYTLTDLDELRDGSINNMSDEEIDKQERIFTYITNQLGTANPSILVTDNTYDPEWYKNNGNQITKLNRYDLELCDFVGLMPFIREEFDGRVFIYFDSEADAKSYVDTVDAINQEDISWDEYYNSKKQDELSIAEKVEADIESHKITPKAIDSLSDIGLKIDDVILLPNLSHELDGSYGNIMVQYYYSPEREQAYLIADY